MNRLHGLGSALLLVAASLAGPAHAFTLVGWHPSGAFWFQQEKAPAVQVCREDTSDIPQGWPEGTSVGPGAACGDMPATIGGKNAIDWAKKESKGVKVDVKSVFGVEIKVETKDNKSTVLAINGDKKLPLGTSDDGPLKVMDQYWRADGRFVVVVLKPAKGDGVVEFSKNVSAVLIGGPAGRKLAERLFDDGQKLYKKRDWSGAGKIYEDAIAADPDWAPVRYARAASEAQGGVGRTAMIENLQWLKEHQEKDAAAKKLLGQAKGDSAFDAWIGDPEVRDLVGLPKVSSMDVPGRLLERDATWTMQGATCKSPWLTLQFKKGGNAQLSVSESCKGKKTTKNGAATYKVTPAGPFVLELKKAIDGVTFPMKATLQLDDSYQQMKLLPDGGEPIGTFEPGGPRLDDSTL